MKIINTQKEAEALVKKGVLEGDVLLINCDIDLDADIVAKTITSEGNIVANNIYATYTKAKNITVVKEIISQNINVRLDGEVRAEKIYSRNLMANVAYASKRLKSTHVNCNEVYTPNFNAILNNCKVEFPN
jgi:hypothetical protein